MAEQIFKNPTGKGDIKLNDCKLSKSIPDYESRAERIPEVDKNYVCLLYTSPSPRDRTRTRMPSSA